MDNLSLWLDASQPSDLTLDANSKVTVWKDRSGNARNMSAFTEAFRPLYSTSDTNGKPAVIFNNNELTIAADVIADERNCTFFVVHDMKSRKGVNQFNTLFTQCNAVNDNKLYLVLNANNMFLDSYLPLYGDITMPEVFPLNAMKLTSSRGTMANRELYSNGIFKASIISENFQDSKATPYFVLGQLAYHASTFHYGYFGINELIAYNRVLTAQEMGTVHAYLKAKWNIV